MASCSSQHQIVTGNPLVIRLSTSDLGGTLASPCAPLHRFMSAHLHSCTRAAVCCTPIHPRAKVYQPHPSRTSLPNAPLSIQRRTEFTTFDPLTRLHFHVPDFNQSDIFHSNPTHPTSTTSAIPLLPLQTIVTPSPSTRFTMESSYTTAATSRACRTSDNQLLTHTTRLILRPGPDGRHPRCRPRPWVSAPLLHP